MKRIYSPLLALGLMFCGLFFLNLNAQSTDFSDVASPKKSEIPVIPEAAKPEPAAFEASVLTQKNARTMTLSVPAPRGMILDREGRPLAQNKVGYHLALDLTKISTEENETRILAWSREKIAQANTLTGGSWKENDERLIKYFHNRRWIPKEVSSVFDEDKARELQKKLPEGLVLLPVYMRYYPEKSLGAHMIGYVGTLQRMPEGPINIGDPLFESSQGKSGFELLFDDDLRGSPGMKRLLFDDKGEKLMEEWAKRPQAGGSVVTTLDLKWQRRAEKVLRNGCERGAMVVIDVNSGDILVMASRPTFDLNDFIPGISHAKYQALLDDPGNPLFGRAFQGEYPPASTFKPVVALTALTNGVVSEKSLINCPYQIKIGNHWFRNHSKTAEGSINVKRALARSCNPWFYQVGIKTGPESFLSVARRLGFGSESGLPLVGEKPGLIPSNEYMVKTHGRKLTDGDTANLSIGQGVMLATPLQVAQAMAGIANGGALPQLRLVTQIQDLHGRVVEAPAPSKRNDLSLDPEAVKAVKQGMVDVVNASYGTGKEADLGFTILAGKTGTAQWGPASKDQRLAWFAGFFPQDNPRFAFAVLYEGKPGQVVSGGRYAAPMVQDFFGPLKEEIKKMITPPARAMIVVEEDDVAAPAEPVMEAEEIDENAPTPDLDEDVPKAKIMDEEDGEVPEAEPVDEEESIPEATREEPEEPEMELEAVDNVEDEPAEDLNDDGAARAIIIDEDE